MKMPDDKISVAFWDSGNVTILDAHGCEIVSWNSDEWIEDPDVVLSIVNAVAIGYEKGAAALLKVIGKAHATCN